jgi:hypothetical protein
VTVTPEQLDAIEARAVASDAGCPACKSDVEIAGTTTRFFISMIRRDQVRALVTAIRERDAEIERIAKKSDTQHGLLCRVSQERNELRDQLRIAREAIEQHRRQLWGTGEVEHPDDVALYAALAGTEGKP